MTDSDRGVVVIGSGPTGAAAAHALVKQGIPTTLLESGTQPSGRLVVQAFGRNLLRRTGPLTEELPYSRSLNPNAVWMHALSPGGLSNYWTCAVPRFHPSDFEEGARLDEKYRWPVTYADLEPYYTRMERLLQVTASARPVPGLPSSAVARAGELGGYWRRIAERAALRGRGLTTMPLATGPAWRVKSGGTPFNSYTDVVMGLQGSPAFRTVLGAHALRLESDDTGLVNRVVYYDRRAGREEALPCSAVVVAAGPIGTTRLLLDSTSGRFPEGLGNDNGIVGKYLHDHPHAYALIETNRPLPRLGHAAYLTRAPYDQSEPLLAAGCMIGARLSRLDRILTMTPAPSRQLGMVIFGTMVPTEANSVRLTSDRDQFGASQVDIRLDYDDAARATTRQARTDFSQILDDAGLAPEMTVPEGGDRLTPGSSVHFAGTVRMHASPQYGATDGWSRLHSVRNVVIADASTFTTCVEKNPTLTAMALAARAADKLSEELKQDDLKGQR